MAKGCINKEFYIGRYIYLKTKLDQMPKVKFGTADGNTVLNAYRIDPATGKEKRSRLSSPKNKDYSALSRLADEKERLEEQLKLLLQSWKEDHGGSLPKIASRYYIVPNTDNRYNALLWSRLKEGLCTVPNKYPVQYKNYAMRSRFETEVAKVLDSLGLDYKYEIELEVSGDLLYPDMSVLLSEYNRCGFIEAMGGLSSVKYGDHNVKKIRCYLDAGLYPNVDLSIVSAGNDYRPDSEDIKRVVGTMLSAIARQHVFKKE